MSATMFRALVSPLLAALFLLCGCGKSEPGAAPAPAGERPASGGLQSALVPGADLLVQCDAAGLRASPIHGAIEARRKAQGGAQGERRWTIFEQATGLGEDDLVTVLLSADLDALDLENPRMGEQLPALPAAVALEFGKPLTFAKLQAAVAAMAADKAGVTPETVELGGHKALRLTSTNPGDPIVHIALSGAPNVVLAALNEAAARAMLERDARADTAGAPAGLEAAAAHLPAGAQIRMLFLASDAMRTRLAETLAGMGRRPEGDSTPQQNQRAMAAAFLQPFKALQTIGLGIKADDAMRLVLAADIADAEACERSAALLNAVLGPMAAQAMARVDPQGKLGVDESLSVQAEGTTMVLSMVMTGDDVANLDLGGAAIPAPAAP